MTKQRTPQQQRSKQTVATIIEAGLICVGRYGVEGTTTRRIAEIAGISVGSLYEYFANKEEVFDAMHIYVVDQVVEMVKPMIPNLAKMTVDEAVRTLLFGYRDLLSGNNGLYLSYSTSFVHRIPGATLKPLNDVLTDLSIQFLMNHPELARIPNLSVTIYIIINGGIATIMRHLRSPSPPFPFEELCEGLVQMVKYMVEGSLAEAD